MKYKIHEIPAWPGDEKRIRILQDAIALARTMNKPNTAAWEYRAAAGVLTGDLDEEHWHLGRSLLKQLRKLSAAQQTSRAIAYLTLAIELESQEEG